MVPNVLIEVISEKITPEPPEKYWLTGIDSVSRIVIDCAQCGISVVDQNWSQASTGGNNYASGSTQLGMA